MRVLTREEIAAAAKPVEAVCAVYFLFNAGEIVYVGKSFNVAARIIRHVDAIKFDATAFIPCPEAHLSVIEAIYIATLRPKYNLRNGAPVQRQYLAAA